MNLVIKWWVDAIAEKAIFQKMDFQVWVLGLGNDVLHMATFFGAAFIWHGSCLDLYSLDINSFLQFFNI